MAVVGKRKGDILPSICLEVLQHCRFVYLWTNFLTQFCGMQLE